jgi:hypothetical protein
MATMGTSVSNRVDPTSVHASDMADLIGKLSQKKGPGHELRDVTFIFLNGKQYQRKGDAFERVNRSWRSFLLMAFRAMLADCFDVHKDTQAQRLTALVERVFASAPSDEVTFDRWYRAIESCCSSTDSMSSFDTDSTSSDMESTWYEPIPGQSLPSHALVSRQTLSSYEPIPQQSLSQHVSQDELPDDDGPEPRTHEIKVAIDALADSGLSDVDRAS